MPTDTRIKLDPQSSVPIFQQIVDGLEMRVMTRALTEGNYLPSVREFAVIHAVNPNTVSKAYQLLQTSGWVESVRGLGLRVRKIRDAETEKRKRQILDAKIQEVLELARMLRVPPLELLHRIEELEKEALGGKFKTARN